MFNGKSSVEMSNFSAISGNKQVILLFNWDTDDDYSVIDQHYELYFYTTQ
jgi:hypothetical protein